MRIRNATFLAFAVLVVLGWSSGASAASCSFKGLGDLPGGGSSSAAYDISADGSVVVGQGRVSVPIFRTPRWEAFCWTETEGVVVLGFHLASGHRLIHLPI